MTVTQTHCVKGHELTPENVLRPASRPTWRVCRTCLNARRAARNKGTRVSADVRFAAKYVVDAATGCWLWQSAINSGGYAKFLAGGRTVGAHRWSYERFVGTIPDGLQIDHLCRVRHCVNPAHLEAVTAAENVSRSTAPSAQAVRTNRCKRDHEFTPENTRVDRRGRRSCKTCQRIHDKKWKARQGTSA